MMTKLFASPRRNLLHFPSISWSKRGNAMTMILNFFVLVLLYHIVCSLETELETIKKVFDWSNRDARYFYILSKCLKSVASDCGGTGFRRKESKFFGPIRFTNAKWITLFAMKWIYDRNLLKCTFPFLHSYGHWLFINRWRKKGWMRLVASKFEWIFVFGFGVWELREQVSDGMLNSIRDANKK